MTDNITDSEGKDRRWLLEGRKGKEIFSETSAKAFNSVDHNKLENS